MELIQEEALKNARAIRYAKLQPSISSDIAGSNRRDFRF